MAVRTNLVKRLGLTHPIIQAPMAGGATTVELVAAVCEAGALGFLGCAYSSPDDIRRTAAAVRAQTERPFGINLFAPLAPLEPPPDPSRAIAALSKAHADLGLPPPSPPRQVATAFDDQLGAVLDSDASVFSFTFGLPSPPTLEAVRNRGLVIAGTATTVNEAIALEAAGVDAVIAQGSEAGAHRGTFDTTFDAGMVGTLSLVPQVVDAVSVPVIASGGIMDGRGVAAALVLGAQAAQLGTAFLTCPESGIPDAHKRAILAAREHATRVTRAFSGRPARALVNELMDRLDAEPDAILPFPLQNALTRPLRSAAAEQGRAEYLSLWAGQGVRLARDLPAAELVAEIARETAAALRHASREAGG